MTKAFWAKGAKSPVGPLYFEGEEEAHAAWGKDALLGGAAAPAPAPAPIKSFLGHSFRRAGAGRVKALFGTSGSLPWGAYRRH